MGIEHQIGTNFDQNDRSGSVNHLQNGYVLQQDNARPHVARATQEWLRDASVTVLKWPAYSPDLNPIEKEWQVMKHRVEKMDRRKINDWHQEIKNLG